METSPATTRAPEGDRREDRALRRRVVALDVGRRIRLGEPEPLRLGHRLVGRPAVLGHLREDEVRRPVHDAEDAIDALSASDSRSGRIRGIPPATAASKYRSPPARSAAANSSSPCAARSSLFPVTTDFPLAERAQQQVPRRLDAPDQLADHVDPGSSTTAAGSSVNRSAGRQTAGPGRVADRHARDLQPNAGSSGDVVTALVEERITAAPTVPLPRRPTRTVRVSEPTVRSSVTRHPDPRGHEYLVLVTVGLAGVPREPPPRRSRSVIERDRRVVVRVDGEDELLDACPPGPVEGLLHQPRADAEAAHVGRHRDRQRRDVPRHGVTFALHVDVADETVTEERDQVDLVLGAAAEPAPVRARARRRPPCGRTAPRPIRSRTEERRGVAALAGRTSTSGVGARSVIRRSRRPGRARRGAPSTPAPTPRPDRAGWPAPASSPS